MRKIGVLLTGLIVLVFLFLLSAVYVQENQYVIVRRFGKVITVHDEAGLKFKVPFVDEIGVLPKNRQTYELPQSDILTQDKKAMIVDEYVVWRIEDPLKFLTTAGNLSEISRRLDASIYNSVKTLLSSMTQDEIISERGSALNDKITENIAGQMKVYGLEVIDAQIKKLDLPPANKEAVYSRMISERLQMAAAYTAEGMEEAAIIRNETDRLTTVMVSQSESDAQAIIASGEAEYMRILREAFNSPERLEFYEFVRSLDALKITMKGDKTLVLPYDSPLTKWFVQN